MVWWWILLGTRSWLQPSHSSSFTQWMEKGKSKFSESPQMIQRGKERWKRFFQSKHGGFTATKQRHVANPGITPETVAGPMITGLSPLQV